MLYFRDHLIAAPLKPDDLGQIIALAKIFPRSFDRGPIEATKN